ncbi:TetR/AcrR family transcriptional regulator [Gryllotalpicola protaetiae]|uniref:TetR/AcrR family transcriptional regulator n=1 Tax=Gryllotalpicola protaetiae TaxID=2419771 RepID=A0A387BF68_9MICO|nr:TetR/AcrR family transcriptional regulator [Gryllotalpicola protaetiae]AYG02635.1 TetR/AcrR family transcriptional regulator [Gryllotalpicola protaetiae]
MPAPGRTSSAEIVAAGRRIVAATGLESLTMQAVATQVGVRAPSLYKRVKGRDELIRLVVEATIDELEERLASVGNLVDSDPAAALADLARELRGFAHENPSGFRLIFGGVPLESRPDVVVYARSAAPLIEATTRLVGAEHALDAARTVTAWANGFLTMELAGEFQLGGDVDRAFEWGLTRVIAAVAAE